MFRYDVGIHFGYKGWDTYSVNANTVSEADYKALMRVKNEIPSDYELIDCIRVYKAGTDKLLRER